MAFGTQRDGSAAIQLDATRPVGSRSECVGTDGDVCGESSTHQWAANEEETLAHRQTKCVVGSRTKYLRPNHTLWPEEMRRVEMGVVLMTPGGECAGTGPLLTASARRGGDRNARRPLFPLWGRRPPSLRRRLPGVNDIALQGIRGVR